MAASKRITDATVEPITSATVKLQARIDSTAEDALITTLIKAARQKIESVTGCALINQTWTYAIDAAPAGLSAEWHVENQIRMSWNPGVGDVIELPVMPVSSVTKIEYYGTDNVATEFSSDYYRLDSRSESGRRARVYLNVGSIWPTSLRSRDALVVTYVAGYGAAASAVPSPLTLACNQLVAHWFNDREATGAVPQGILDLTREYTYVGV